MKQEKDRVTADRRKFLKLAGVGAVIGGTAAVTGTETAQAATDKAKEDGRYHESEHVKRYYDLARF